MVKAWATRRPCKSAGGAGKVCPCGAPLWKPLLLIVGFPLAFVAFAEVFRQAMAVYHAWGLGLFCCLIVFYPLYRAEIGVRFGRWALRSALLCGGVTGVLHLIWRLFDSALQVHGLR